MFKTNFTRKLYILISDFVKKKNNIKVETETTLKSDIIEMCQSCIKAAIYVDSCL